MNFADKLIDLRRKKGWSQEDLALHMDVTRQSVSKWESGQSQPDIEKIIRLSDLFSVSTDYLLKDDAQANNQPSDTNTSLRILSSDEAEKFISVKNKTSSLVAFAVFLCIISPICLLILIALSETAKYNISENTASGVGMIVLLTLVAAAVGIFIYVGSKTKEFNFLETEDFRLSHGTDKVVNELQEQYKSRHTLNNIIGAFLCIFSVVPIFAGITMNGENGALIVIMVALTLFIAAVGAAFFIKNGIISASFEALLQQGDYTKQRKKERTVTERLSTVYWLTATAIYLGYSFITDNWQYSWVVWAVAGVLYPAVLAIIRLKKK